MSVGYPAGKKRKSRESAVLQYFKLDGDYMVCQAKVTDDVDRPSSAADRICGDKIKIA